MKRMCVNGSKMMAALLAVMVCSGNASAEQVRLNLATSAGVVRVGQPEKVYLKVGLDGLALEAAARRTPVNVAIVLDKSGSMEGEKIEKAKEAAKMAVDRLGPDDIVSVIAYNSAVQVLVPATLATQKGEIHRRIDRIYAEGSTALFSGVSKGAREVRKFIDSRRVSRIVLLSDGQANVGPSSPYELADLGASLIREGISVTTVGLGLDYNEDLMAALAEASDGNHGFARDADDLAAIFNYEFGDLLSVVARDVRIEVRLSDGVRPLRVLGRKAQIYGRRVMARINQLYAAQEKFLMIEVEVPPGTDGAMRDLASVSITYDDTVTQRRATLIGGANVRYSSSEAAVAASENETVLVSSIELLSNENNRLAVTLRDRGDTKRADQVLDENVRFLDTKATKLKSKRLKKLASDNRQDKESLYKPEPEWRAQRKGMRARQNALDQQQMW